MRWLGPCGDQNSLPMSTLGSIAMPAPLKVPITPQLGVYSCIAIRNPGKVTIYAMLKAVVRISEIYIRGQ